MTTKPAIAAWLLTSVTPIAWLVRTSATIRLAAIGIGRPIMNLPGALVTLWPAAASWAFSACSRMLRTLKRARRSAPQATNTNATKSPQVPSSKSPQR